MNNHEIAAYLLANDWTADAALDALASNGWCFINKSTGEQIDVPNAKQLTYLLHNPENIRKTSSAKKYIVM